MRDKSLSSGNVLTSELQKEVARNLRKYLDNGSLGFLLWYMKGDRSDEDPAVCFCDQTPAELNS